MTQTNTPESKVDVEALLDHFKANPFEEIIVRAPHCGVVRFESIEPGTKLFGPAGRKCGSKVATIEREKNVKAITAPVNGQLKTFTSGADGRFVEAGSQLLILKHYLTKEEVISAILRQVLSLFHAPERAKYYFVPEVDKKIKAQGCRSVKVRDGQEIFIVSRMKREKPLSYSGPEGKIYTVYFDVSGGVDAGAPLIGVCPEHMVDQIEDVVNRVRTSWVEQG